MEDDKSTKLSRVTFFITAITCVLLASVVFFFILPEKAIWTINAHIPAASSFASDIDWLHNMITFFVGFWFVVAQVLLFGFLFMFRRKPGVKADYIAGDTKEQKRWITVPHFLVILCDVVLIAGTILVWIKVKQELPPSERTVRVTAQQWAWIFQHPGPDGKLDTTDDVTTVDELHLEKDVIYHFELQAMDVLHSFSIPAFRLKQDAVPGRVIKGWFEPTMAGDFDIQCAEMCGIGHGLMVAKLTVAEGEEHRQWLASVNAPVTTAAANAAGTADFE